MVGLPGQSLETLADDLLLMKELPADMLGIGPFLPHPETPLAACPAGDLSLTLKVLAVARLLTRTTNIPATTALANLDPGDVSWPFKPARTSSCRILPRRPIGTSTRFTPVGTKQRRPPVFFAA